MNQTKDIIRFISFIGIAAVLLIAVALYVHKVDPFFHYHAPNTEKYFYRLDNERSQNDGIIRNFEYDALITGNSQTENFKTSDLDTLFGTNAIKVAYSGATSKELHDSILKALQKNPDLKTVVCGVSMNRFDEDSDQMRNDLGTFPDYLYDENPLNDVNYLFNRDVLFKRIYEMAITNDEKGIAPGITSFDDYANWMYKVTFGVDSVCKKGVKVKKPEDPVHISEETKEMVLRNIGSNFAQLAKDYPETEFYYFFPPYSVVWWKDLVDKGTVYEQTEMEKLVIEELLQYDNVKLFSFNTIPELTTDLNNYKDKTHYGDWINTLMLRYMKEGRYQLTVDNYETYLEEELALYTNFDYSSLNDQEDYEDDYEAAKQWEAGQS